MSMGFAIVLISTLSQLMNDPEAKDWLQQLVINLSPISYG